MPAFDPRPVELDPEIEVVDVGEYVVKIRKCTDNIDNFGHKVKVLYQIISPDSDKNKLIIETFNIGHAKPIVEEIGKKQFKQLLKCVGMHEQVLENFSDIEGKELKLDVDVVPHYKDVTLTQNKIKKHMSVGSVSASSTMTHSKQDDLPF